MNIEEFNFDLPEELIAQSPLKNRTSSRLLVLNRKSKQIQHQQFKDLTKYLKKGDCLVLNDTRVLPARLHGIKQDTGAKIEILLLNEQTTNVWEALVKPAKKVKKGTIITFGDGLLKATCVGSKEDGGRIFKLHYKGIFHNILDQLGEMPLPPYIKETLAEQNRYQTVYAKKDGSAAAPTAGLHFTKELLSEIKSMGVKIAYITLHVGLGTFRPVNVEQVEDHVMHEEYYYMSNETATLLNQVKSSNGRIISVGTTSTRTLETIARENNGKFVESSGWTNIFIYPPFEFKAIDGQITNFHLPKSTLLMLVSALVDKNTMMDAYQQAIDLKYRFFSFGDAMLILA